MKYYVISEKLEGEEVGAYTTYGIELREGGRSLRRISDVSQSYTGVRRLCGKCNRLKLDSIHIDDVIEDFITANCCI